VLPLIGEFGGRVIDTAGDGILADFPSATRSIALSPSSPKWQSAMPQNTAPFQDN
jgi:class 3 adenylate cyclase